MRWRRGQPGVHVRGLQAGERGRLDAARIQAVVRPVAGEDEVVVAGLVGAQAVAVGPRGALHVAVRWVDVGGEELTCDRVGTVRTAGTTEQIPSDPGRTDDAGQQVGEVVRDELPRVLLDARAHAARVRTVDLGRCHGVECAQKYAIVPGRSSAGQHSTASSWSIEAQVLNGVL